MEKMLIILIVAGLLLSLNFVYGIMTLSFGGRLLSVPIPCLNGLMLIVGPPSPGNYIFQAGVSTLKFCYNIAKPGVQLLGNYFPGGVCILPPPAPSIPAKGTIFFVGTSCL